MTELLVQQFLKTKTLRQLEQEHGVEASFSRDKSKFSLNYSQINSHPRDELANQCRGLILRFIDHDAASLDHSGATQICAYPFDRFFNLGDPACASLDLESIVVQEKYDGTLCIIYFDYKKSKWCVATRSCPEADILINDFNLTFFELFEKTISQRFDKTYSFEQFCKYLNKDYTYMFELVSPYNQVVVKYDYMEIFQLGQRNNLSLKEEMASGALCPRHKFSTFDKVIEFVNSRNADDYEGVILVDKNFNRVKVKSQQYVLIHRASSNLLSAKNMLKAILEDKIDDVYPLLPSIHQENVNLLKKKIIEITNRADQYFLAIQQLMTHTDYLDINNEQARFAAIVKDYSSPQVVPYGYFFDRRAGKCNSMLEWMKSRLERSQLRVMLEFLNRTSV